MLAATVENKRLLLAPPDLSIAELAAVLQRCKLHIGADSGVLHLAMALGTPTLALFRDYPGKAEWLPRGAMHHHLSGPCECITLPQPPCAAQEEARCLAQITPASVFKEVRQILTKPPAI